MSVPTPIAAGSIEIHVVDGVATISFQHPKSNSLPGVLLGQLATAFDRVGADTAARVIVLRSEGNGAFCAGASFDELRALRTPEEGQAFFSGFAQVILAMRRCPQFVVTRVQGRAVGGGVGLVAASDYAVAVSHAQVRLSELAVGIGPFVVGPVIERKIGRAHFAALAVDFDWREATWAERCGLYSRTEENIAAADAVLVALTRKLARANPDAVRELKQILWEGTEHWDSLLFERAATSGSLILSEAAQHALGAM